MDLIQFNSTTNSERTAHSLSMSHHSSYRRRIKPEATRPDRIHLSINEDSLCEIENECKEANN